MTPGRLLILAAAAAALNVGCAVSRTQTSRSIAPTTAPLATTRPLDPKATIPLNELEPAVVLPQPHPTTRPAQAPLEAIELYAQARHAQLQNRRNTAINLIERALEIDPDSFELNLALGRAYLAVGSSAERAIAAFTRAAELNPDDLDVQVELGRAHQARNDLPKAIERFRLATLTTEYADGDALAGVVDYRLGVALQQQGYDRAALDCYERLRRRLDHLPSSSRATPELAYLLARPEALFEEMGKLHEKLGNLPAALESYRSVAERSPNDFDTQARIIKTLSQLGRHDQAVADAAELVRRFHASSQSLALLREAYARSGNQGALVETLEQLRREQPSDRAILFALADTLASSGKTSRAHNLLDRAIEQHHGDVEIVQRLYDFYLDRDEVVNAAKLIIRVTTQYPDTTAELTPLFDDLTLLSRRNSLRLRELAKLEVPPRQIPSRQYWIWSMAVRSERPATARAALDVALEAEHPFDPACRAMLSTYLFRSDLDQASQDRAIDDLIESVRARNRPDLAAELRGMVAVHRNQLDQAARDFAEAVRLSARPAPDLLLQQALVLLRSGNSPRFEQIMWKLISDRPRYDPGYQILISYYKQAGADSRAMNVINTWLGADPTNVNARLVQATEMIQQRLGGEALSILRKLFDERPDDAEVVVSLVRVMSAAGQVQQAIDLLEAERSAHPNNRVAAEALMELYVAQERPQDAIRVIDDTRSAVAGDPDLLYYVAHLYQRLEQQQTCEQVLQDVLRLDPTHAEAGNDLGYNWADSGRNLERAESLIRLAVDADPDNPAYLDSLGWVLYKRGEFADARKLLEQAAQPPESADPVILDHLGDVLYRLGLSADARQAWTRSLERLQNVRERQATRILKLQVEAKLKQVEAGQPVNVAPVVETSSANQQAQTSQ